MKHISIIVALAENNAIGKDNRLLCHIPGDLPRFKKITGGHTVVMGRNTFLSLPKGPLPDRKNIVITDRDETFEGCVMVHSVNEALEKCTHGENFVIGGGMVYKQFLPLADRLYLTKIHKHFEADTFFPEINYQDWQLVSKERKTAEDKNFSYSYLIYERKKNGHTR